MLRVKTLILNYYRTAGTSRYILFKFRSRHWSSGTRTDIYQDSPEKDLSVKTISIKQAPRNGQNLYLLIAPNRFENTFFSILRTFSIKTYPHTLIWANVSSTELGILFRRSHIFVLCSRLSSASRIFLIACEKPNLFLGLVTIRLNR